MVTRMKMLPEAQSCQSIRRPWTYRVEKVPRGTDAEGLKELFRPEDRPHIQVRSLAPAISDDHTDTATILFTPPSMVASEPRVLHTVSVDSSFYGFTPLYTPKGLIAADLIAVTGLAGHAIGSWSCSAQEIWLRDYIPSDLPDVRVLTYGYPSPVNDDARMSIISDHVSAFISRLRRMRERADCQNRPVVLIGHSLGGLIIKKAVIDINDAESWPGLRPFISLIIFLGCPHHGLETTALETLVRSKPSSFMISELKPGSPTLRSLHTRFSTVATSIDIMSFYETQLTQTAIEKPDGSWKKEGPLAMMVPYERAVLFLPKEEQISCDADHSQIAKLSADGGGIYSLICRTVRRAIAPGLFTVLVEAIRIDDVAKAEQLLEGGFDLSYADENGNVSLQLAARHNAVAVVKLLLDHGANPNAVNPRDETALHQAATKGNAAVVELLHSRGAMIEAETKQKMRPLHIAALQGHAAAAERLIQNGAALEHRWAKNGYTPLHFAAHAGHVDVIELLLLKGAFVNAETFRQTILGITVTSTPLLCAAREGHTAAVQTLLNRGARVGKKMRLYMVYSDSLFPPNISTGRKAEIRALLKEAARREPWI